MEAQSNFPVTLMTFSYMHEMAVLRGRLEAEGIKCFVADEMTVGANPFLSNAIGGVRLQVRPKDYDRAVEVLIENGYTPDTDDASSKFVERLERISKQIPLVNQLSVEYRVLVVAVAFVCFMLLIGFLKYGLRTL